MNIEQERTMYEAWLDSISAHSHRTGVIRTNRQNLYDMDLDRGFIIWRDARAAIEADRKRAADWHRIADERAAEIVRLEGELDRQCRGEPVTWPLASKEESDMGWTLDYRFLEQVEKVASQRTDFTTSMEAAEQVLIAAAELLRAPQPLSESDIPAEPVKCIGCEGKPALENNPCSVCGKEAEAVGGLSAGQLAEILTAYIKPEIIGDALEKLENAPWELSKPVKPHLTVKYDDKGDYLYICCDSNEPAEAEENDQGILLWRAYSDGRLVGVTIPNFIGPYIKPEKVDAESSVPSDMDIDELSREWGLLSAAYPSKSMVRDFARALLARYK